MAEKVNLKYICKVLDFDDEEAGQLLRAEVLVGTPKRMELSASIHGYIHHLRDKKGLRRTAKTQREAAKILGVDQRTINRLVSDNGYCKGNDNLYDIEEAEKLLRERAENALAKSKSNGDGTGDLRRHEIRLKSARADQMEIRVKEERGRLVDIVLVKQEQIARELEFKKAVMGIPKMAPRLVGLGMNEINSILTRAVTKGMRKLARKG